MDKQFDEEPKPKRRRVVPSHRWTADETRQLVEAVRNEVASNPEAFEKPVAQKFYAIIAEKADKIAGINWSGMKGKMRYMKQAYMEAVKWKGQTGAGLQENGDEKSVPEYVEKICPYFSLLEEIFAQRKGVNPAVIIESSNIDSLMKDQEESSGTVDIEENSSSCTALPSPEVEATPSTSRAALSLSFKKQIKKKDDQRGSVGLLLAMQEKRYDLEVKKFQWQKEKEEKEAELNKLKLAQELELKKLVIERDESLAIAKLKVESETELKKFEMELHFKKQIKKKDDQRGSVGLLLAMQEKRYDLEVKKFQWQKEKEESEAELNKLKLAQELELKKLEIERDESLAIAKLKVESETELKKFEMELHFKNKLN